MNLLKNHFTIFIFLCLFVPLSATAQGILSLSPSTGSYRVGESFSVIVNLNTGGESVNASTGQINFDNSKLQVVSLGYSQSIFSLWTDNPSFSNPAGTINFSGGVPSPGFTGASGSILRITFKGKASGQAPVNFLSGSVLANDGQGTNIADGLKGALYAITPLDSSSEATTITNLKSESTKGAERPITTPIITKWSKQLNENDALTIEGLGYPLAKISVIIQKDTEELTSGYTFSGFDGKFRFTYADKVKTGYYNVWARNIAEDGNQSGLSDPVTTEVIAPTFIKVGSFVINYSTIIIALVLLLLFIISLLLLVWFFYKKTKKQQGIEISEAGQTLEKSFKLLCSDIDEHIAKLKKARVERNLTSEEIDFLEQFEEELSQAKGVIAKEIRDISN
ncbi:MAG: hypothetical protein A3A96_00510 [Candidatus Zambryskibacteria bacterium RIFCSPLOWO2_01_FULL_39_39]|uniref:Cohesin domain-containing protein n=1 Tax=Candidatus Zambryskibacteria bacterium RIFCSPLOWO2_01_FULL_39_39 TaxID=1802758 RepID=A0A1G2TX78_9BACT|nr:MAG: hypothetical protein UT00_C0001G0004 [Parcubacteria group bacterium GW2011_GWA1_38_7]OHA87810.1 MAG: hypothetical protein A2644_01385 [Candidatus Zambryskibacteria bacterium RIFCSPHIGHO2_01_FULL_39_63]OHA94965.1 MAG: hypothetical protein A3B88_01130 [Candidatus Zambryskibacteria bacterium RIFCSPHIGHO2_02_FULL_39_19]OHA99146.1 MAG: hypothetical protein A3F20_03080 [Candidatus Zambryskibacteria bacterium RIFCSPHIGHO2_12_FULL_39_21]OHB01908.1 MAG: hypothetical protein A3A96_00510 [Candidat